MAMLYLIGLVISLANIEILKWIKSTQRNISKIPSHNQLLQNQINDIELS